MTDQTFDTDFSSVQIPRFPAVYTVKQTLTDEQKAQARENIGAVDTTTAENLQKDATAAQSAADAAQKDATAAQSAADAAQKGAAAAQSAADAAQKGAAAAQSTADAAQKGAAAAQSTADAAQKGAAAAQSTADAAQRGAAAAQSAADAAQKDATAAQSAADAAQRGAAAAQSMAEKGVSFHAQTLTDEQKAQARKNIGAAAPGEGGGGGGGATPDWNAAEGEPGHILNRTHWVDSSLVEVLPELTFHSSSGNGNYLETPLGLTAGKTYIVNWEGAEYRCTAITVPLIGHYTATVLGDYSKHNENAPASGEPFGVMEVNEETAEAMGVPGKLVWIKPEDDTSRDFTISIVEDRETVHKLPGKFLPDGVPYVDGVETVEILQTCTPMYDEDEGWFVLADAPALEGGKTYTVNYNGIEYTCVGFDARSIGGPGVYVGDIYTLTGGHVGTAPTGEPFVLASAFEDGVQGIVIIDLTGATELTLSISETWENIHKLDNKYLDLDWIPKAGKPVFNGAITNTDTSQLSGESVYVFSLTAGESSALIVGGNVYEVVLDGMKYTCKGTARQEMTGTVLLGNLGFLSLPDVENTGEPFLMVSAVNLNSFDVIGSYFSDPNADEQTISLSITDVSGVKKLPEEFLPPSVPLLFNVPFTVDLVGQEVTCDLSFAEVYAKASNSNTITRCVAQISGADQVSLGALAAISSNELSFSVAMGVDSSAAQIFTIIMHSDDTCSLVITRV